MQKNFRMTALILYADQNITLRLIPALYDFKAESLNAPEEFYRLIKQE